MKINRVEIENFRGIEKAEIDFSGNLNVFVGINGSGKSTILDAIAISLSWFVNRVQRVNASGRPIPDASIKNGASNSSIRLFALDKKEDYTWCLTKNAKGMPVLKSDLLEVSMLASSFLTFPSNNDTLPVIAYYPINRIVDKIVPEISVKENINILDIYENALGGKTNYQSFFEWFRLQDDIINEKAQYRSLWMKNNKTWLKKRTKKLLGFLGDANQTKEYVPVDPKAINFKDGEPSRTFDQLTQAELKVFYDAGHFHLVKIKDKSEEKIVSRENGWFNQLVDRFTKDDFIFEEPRYLFRELIELLHANEFRNRSDIKYDRIMHDIEYMMHKMMTLSDARRDNLIDVDRFPMSTIGRIVENIHEINSRKDYVENGKMIAFIWDALLLSVQLTLWWLSDKARKEVEKLFAENDPIKHKLSNDQLGTASIDFQIRLNTLMLAEARRLDKATKSGGRESRWVTEAIENFLPGYKNLRVTRIPQPHLLIDKEGITISLDQLSDGEKNLLVLVGDIARRLSIGNPYSSNPLEGNGIILIDEIDLHLHPGWQRLMIPQLTKVFPNCQFIITTHSPQVLSHTKPENIFILKNEKSKFSYSKPTESYGQTTDRILEDLLGVDARPHKEKEMIRQLFILIQDGELDKAKELASKLNKIIGEDPEIYKANVLIKRKAAIGK